MRRRSDERFHDALDGLHEDDSWLGRVLKKRIIVHTRQDQSIEGVLMEHVEDGLILRAANLLLGDGKKTTMAGEVFVPRENIAFAQLDE